MSDERVTDEDLKEITGYIEACGEQEALKHFGHGAFTRLAREAEGLRAERATLLRGLNVVMLSWQTGVTYNMLSAGERAAVDALDASAESPHPDVVRGQDAVTLEVYRAELDTARAEVERLKKEIVSLRTYDRGDLL